MKRIRSRTVEKKWQQRFSHYKSMEIFSGVQGQLTPQLVIWSGRISNSCRALMHVIVTCKYEKDRMKNRREKVATPFFTHYGSYMLPWKPEFWSDLAQNLMAPFLNPNDASDKITLWSACWLRKYSCLKMWTDARTDPRTDESSTGIL